MDITKSQSDFEAWWNAPEQAELRSMLAMGWGFRIWKAARESIEVDIDWPEANDDFWKDGEEGIYATGHTDGRQQTTDAVVKALRTAGIRITGESE